MRNACGLNIQYFTILIIILITVASCQLDFRILRDFPAKSSGYLFTRMSRDGCRITEPGRVAWMRNMTQGKIDLRYVILNKKI